MKVLVVDDEALARKVIGYFLSVQGWEVRHAAGYPEALRLATAWPPDVLVCDWKLGADTGLELARSLRESSPGLPIIFISGLPVETLIPRAADLAGCLFVQKPCDWEGFGDLVREAAERSDVRQAGLCPPEPVRRSGNLPAPAVSRA